MRIAAQNCTCAGESTAESAGHTLTAIQARLASATPSKWVDAIVQSVNANGTLVVVSLFDGVSVTLWNHADLRDAVSVGEPVSLHSVYGVLAASSQRHSVAVV